MYAARSMIKDQSVVCGRNSVINYKNVQLYILQFSIVQFTRIYSIILQYRVIHTIE